MRFIYIEVRDVRDAGEDTSVLSFDSVEVTGVSTEEEAYEMGPHQLDTQRDLANIGDDTAYGHFMNDYIVTLEN